MWSLEKAFKVNVVIAQVNAIIGHSVNYEIRHVFCEILFSYKLIDADCRIYMSITDGMIGPENGLPLVQRQRIFWTNIAASSIEPLGTAVKFESKYCNFH